MALEIVAAGPGRTGTASLKVALEELGIGHCYHRASLHCGSTYADMAQAPTWADLFRAKYQEAR